MRAVGLKALKNRLSEYIRLVARGETILVTDREQLRRLSTAGTYAAHMSGAAFAVVLVAPPGTDFDLGQAAAYMQLGATAHGVGSCVTTLHDETAAHSILGVPGELTCRWSIAFGYPAEAPSSLKAGGRKHAPDGAE